MPDSAEPTSLHDRVWRALKLIPPSDCKAILTTLGQRLTDHHKPLRDKELSQELHRGHQPDLRTRLSATWGGLCSTFSALQQARLAFMALPNQVIGLSTGLHELLTPSGSLGHCQCRCSQEPGCTADDLGCKMHYRGAPSADHRFRHHQTDPRGGTGRESGMHSHLQKCS